MTLFPIESSLTHGHTLQHWAIRPAPHPLATTTLLQSCLSSLPGPCLVKSWSLGSGIIFSGKPSPLLPRPVRGLYALMHPHSWFSEVGMAPLLDGSSAKARISLFFVCFVLVSPAPNLAYSGNSVNFCWIRMDLGGPHSLASKQTPFHLSRCTSQPFPTFFLPVYTTVAFLLWWNGNSVSRLLELSMQKSSSEKTSCSFLAKTMLSVTF